MACLLGNTHVLLTTVVTSAEFDGRLGSVRRAPRRLWAVRGVPLPLGAFGTARAHPDELSVADLSQTYLTLISKLLQNI